MVYEEQASEWLDRVVMHKESPKKKNNQHLASTSMDNCTGKYLIQPTLGQ